jgi:hypothetical protein
MADTRFTPPVIPSGSAARLRMAASGLRPSMQRSSSRWLSSSGNSNTRNQTRIVNQFTNEHTRCKVFNALSRPVRRCRTGPFLGRDCLRNALPRVCLDVPAVMEPLPLPGVFAHPALDLVVEQLGCCRRHPQCHRHLRGMVIAGSTIQPVPSAGKAYRTCRIDLAIKLADKLWRAGDWSVPPDRRSGSWRPCGISDRPACQHRRRLPACGRG